ncbi:hypothetical protein GGR00_001297 [Aminobacter aganoensis]|uniref:Uncharacterized protein n=1 Tax=Aminobacter aganoensis TaxID=83264 RepID=A0A7X0F5K4_9HYPH|nr:hypothetical protein [Aminobacter aganoensis]
MDSVLVRGASLEPTERELWRPSKHDQLHALEILFASDISSELRSVLMDRERELATRED